MAILKDLIVSGSSRLLGKLYTNDIEIGNDLTVTGATTTTKLIVNTTVNQNKNSAVNSSTGDLAVIIGTPTGKHIAMDVDEIAAKNGVTTASALWLNYGGGAVNLSTDAKIVANNGTLTAPTISNTTLTSTTSTITTANITTANTNTINNADMITTSALDVKGKLHAVEYDLENIMDLGGSFVVAPTLIVPSSGSGTKTLTVTKSNSTTVVMTVRDPSITSGGIAGFAWANNYKVKVSGLVNNTVLGTCDGYINTTNVGSNTISLTVTMDAETVTAIATTVTTYKLNIMLYNTDTSSATAVTKPLGIYLQHYQLTNNPIINVWNGQTTTPKVRIGYLGGITYDGSSLGTNAQNSWGLYSDNVFLEGQIIAKGGTIAGWTIGDGYITTNSNRTTYDNTSYTGMTMTASGIGARGSATSYFNLSTGGGLTAVGATVTGVITANTGYIGGTSGWTIASQQLYSGTIGADNSLHLGTKNLGNNTSIGSRQGSDWRLTVGQHFGVTNTGALYCNDIHAVGGDIAGWRIESSYLANGTATAPAANVLLLSPNGTSSSYTIAGQAKTGWMITAGTTFGVNKDGGVYATGGKIGGFNITTNAIYSTTNALGTTANNVYVGTEGISLGTTFKVTKAGVLNATDATITGDITAESFSALDSNSKERATVNTNGFIVKDASGNTVATLSNDLTLGQVVANRYNVFIDADVGIQNRKNTSVLSQFDSTSIKFYDGSGTAAANITAQFLSTGATIGKTSTNHVLLDSSGMKVKNGGTVLADFGSTITLGQTTGQAAVIDGNGMQIYKGGTKVAEFGGNEITIGKTTGGHIILDSDSMDIYKNNNTKIAEFGDTIKLGTGKNRTEVSPGDLSMYYLHDYVPPISLYITHAPFDSEGNAGNIRPEISLSGFDVDDNLEVDGEITECYITPYFVRCNKFMNNSDDSIYQLYKGNNSSPFYIYGNNKIITRIATKTSSVDNPSTSFMIGNGYYAAGSDSSGNIVNNNINMYLCGGTDSTSKYIQSYPVYNRTYNYGANMYITVNGVLGRSTSSSIRYKHDVEYYTNKDNSTINESEILVTKKKAKENPESILGIPIVTFKYNEGYVNGEADFDYNKPILGLIAEDVAKICPECATYIEDDDGNKIPEAWDEKALLVRLLYVVQKQNKMIEELQKEVQKWQ